MHELTLLSDLAVVMIVAAAVTILFHRFRQPVVRVKILAGVMVVAVPRGCTRLVNSGPDKELKAGCKLLLLGGLQQPAAAGGLLTEE